MIKHIVMWKFKEGNEQKISEFLKGLEGLVGQIDVIRSLKTGMNANPKRYRSSPCCSCFYYQGYCFGKSMC